MKLPFKWLKDYVAVSLTPEKLAQRLTMAGLEVERMENVNADIVFEFEVTPNRPDCLSVYGLARETAAVLDKPLKKIHLQNLRWPTKKSDVKILDGKDCPRYIGVVLVGVLVKPSEEWIQTRLGSAGVRSINNIVDITNFCLMETGQPLHAFDYDKLDGGKIIVRRAEKGEKITTIDGVARELDPSILVVADSKRPVAIAGVMGGKDTEVTQSTKNILLESACFDPVLVRRASRKLGLSSDSSYRFERGVNFENIALTSHRAAALILKNAGGKIVSRIDVSSKVKKVTPKIEISPQRINHYLGANIPASRCQRILKQLGCTVSGQAKNFKVSSPAFRNDLKCEEDIVEEIARIIGYDRLPESLPVIKVSNMLPDPRRLRRRVLRDSLLAQGLDEIVTYTMINRDLLKKSALGDLKGVTIQNPLSKDQEMLRPSILPSLLNVILFNMNHGQKDLRLFELGKVYPTADEKEILGIVLMGDRFDDWRQLKKEDMNFFDLKGILESTLQRAGFHSVNFSPVEKMYFEQGQAAQITLKGRVIGECGRISSSVLQQWDIKREEPWVALIEVEEIYKEPLSEVKYQLISEYPIVSRDLSLALKRNVTLDQVNTIIRREGKGILKAVKFVEEYLGEKISSDQRGLVLSLSYQSSQKTLKEDEVNQLHEGIVQSLIKELGAVRR
jgi:phenylalanyl-tRNA synthetase beta chain